MKPPPGGSRAVPAYRGGLHWWRFFSRCVGSQTGIRTRVFTGATFRRGREASWRHRPEESDMSATTEKSGPTAIRPFHVDIPEDALDDLRRRIAAARLPSRELVQDRSQGVQLATIQELARY